MMKKGSFFAIGFVLAFFRNLTFIFQDLRITNLIYFLFFILIYWWDTRDSNKWTSRGLIAGLYILILPKIVTIDGGIPLAIFTICVFLTKKIKQRTYRMLALSCLIYATLFLAYWEFSFHSRIREFDKIVDIQAYDSLKGQVEFPENNHKVKIVELWFNDCGYCRPSLAHLSNLRQSYRRNPNVQFTSINIVNAPHDEILETRNRIGFNLPVIIDTASYFTSIKESHHCPSLLIIDPNNHLRYEYSGYSTSYFWLLDQWLEDTINELLSSI